MVSAIEAYSPAAEGSPAERLEERRCHHQPRQKPITPFPAPDLFVPQPRTAMPAIKVIYRIGEPDR